MPGQENVERVDALNKKLRADLDALQRKHTSATDALSQKKAMIERNNEIERQRVVQVTRTCVTLRTQKQICDLKDTQKRQSFALL